MMKQCAMGVGLVAALLAAAVVAAKGVTPENTTAEVPLPLVEQLHTMQDFDNLLHQGMSYDNAARTLGYPGHEVFGRVVEHLPEAPSHANIYMWPNPNGSRILLVFSGDRLVDKHQFGLR